MVWKRSAARPSEGSSAAAGQTTVEVVDSRNRRLAEIAVSLPSLQAEAESRGKGTDPINVLVDLILANPAFASVTVDVGDRRRFESMLTSVAIDGAWPARLTVKGSRSVAAVKTGNGHKPGPFRSSTTDSLGDDLRTGESAPLSTINPAPELFEQLIRFPSEEASRTYRALVGLDGVKARLIKEAVLLTRPERLQQWSQRYHASPRLQVLDAFRSGAPFVIFAGDVGTGKTALATSFGDAIARELGESVAFLKMSIQTRGSGIVGDMTRQISNAFRFIGDTARRTNEVTILLLDEADALGESRETQQMHHEDRAGVNALIQGVDQLRGSGLPLLVVFCSNRLDSIDPAIRRRAVDIVEFHRPNRAQRRQHLNLLFGDLGLSPIEIERLVDLTGPGVGRDYGFTYSDISDRFARTAVLQAFPDKRIDFALLEAVVLETAPTRPFGMTAPKEDIGPEGVDQSAPRAGKIR